MGEIIGVFKMQETLLDEKIKISNILIRNVSILRQTKSRSSFMLHR
jgi:hypothetical protein